jgi:hypothetical protein
MSKKISEQITDLTAELDQQDLEDVSGGAADVVICNGGCATVAR